MSPLVAQNLVVKAGADYSLTFNMENGRMTLNGQPLPLGALMGGKGQHQ